MLSALDLLEVCVGAWVCVWPEREEGKATHVTITGPVSKHQNTASLLLLGNSKEGWGVESCFWESFRK